MAGTSTKMALRSIYIDLETDEQLRRIAFRQSLSKGELIRRFVDAGLKAEAGKTAISKKIVSVTVKANPKIEGYVVKAKRGAPSAAHVIRKVSAERKAGSSAAVKLPTARGR